MVSIYLRSAFILTLGFVTSAAAIELSSSDLDALLASIPPTEGRSVEFREEKTLRLLKDPVVSEGKLWFQPPNRFRREITSPRPAVTVSNGLTLWLYYPEFKEVETYDLRKNHPISRMLDAMTASFDLGKLRQLFEIQGTQNDQGIILQLRPKNSALRKNVQSLTLELSPALRLTRSHLIMKGGSRAVTTYQNETHTPLDSKLFEFSPPADAKVISPLER